ncbi:Hypothetical predicted protein [Podarcis lilfordi]|uniref:Uncharacterized protein n=1 Tax=Podarcis lilfordi TaxID=74358 RepID=A0AA35K1F4_9SAUR|nr:Hypothetical predicted protein [Podarcis lilfordi]
MLGSKLITLLNEMTRSSTSLQQLLELLSTPGYTENRKGPTFCVSWWHCKQNRWNG